ncbi:prepilin-type N-terminal cleavage/methylation domain-containing protein [Pararhodospirillum oryzae]|uniref:Prepilin-type N-terminal cleavage/methylation domain-containing protein n=1 Tax=Pararhodospirillum oryzae TaxID=478448 RepID=A0A512HBM7_9PROT|nr:prepilin-type N-terminal cleavage/methylation domain-containing protein [Pararhodospirillum oryzae]GEO82848.1 prepilin-type N-terminal cleavage/methylation domain-containing protein [Pararhodospirillum oryzae]
MRRSRLRPHPGFSRPPRPRLRPGFTLPGFTLVEMSVVLVLIGLLLGGVLKGQQLIEATRLRMTISQWEGVRAAFSAFQERYGALPGDFAAATTYINGPMVANGDGDGVIGAANRGMGDPAGAESARAWEHLAAAGFLSGVRLDEGPAQDSSTLPARLSGLSLVIVHGRFGLTAGTGHWLRLQDTPAGAPTRNSLSGVQALEIDTRFDDGNADTGFIVMSDFAGTAPGQADGCKNADGTYASGAVQTCTPVFFLE